MTYREAVHIVYEANESEGFREARAVLESGVGRPTPTVTQVQNTLRGAVAILRKDGRLRDGLLEAPPLEDDREHINYERVKRYDQIDAINAFGLVYPRSLAEAAVGQAFLTLAETLAGRSFLAQPEVATPSITRSNGVLWPSHAIGGWNRREDDDQKVLAVLEEAIPRVGRLYDPENFDLDLAAGIEDTEYLVRPHPPHREIPNPFIQEDDSNG